MFFAFRRVLCSSYFGSFFASFLASIFGRLLVRFWCHFGVFWGGFGRAKWVIFGIDFRMRFQECVCMCALGVRGRVDASWERLRAAQERPRAAQERPRAAQERSWVAPGAVLAAVGSFFWRFWLLWGRSWAALRCINVARFPFLLGKVFLKLFFALFSLLKINMFFDRFWVAFGSHVGSILGAQIDRSRAKFGPRWLLKRYFLKNVNFHETSAGVVSGAFPGPQDDPPNDPRSPQDGSKIVLDRFFHLLIFLFDF